MNLPNQKPWRIWYSADNCVSWRSSRASFGSCARALAMAMEMVGPRLLERLHVPAIALRAVHTGTRATSEVFTLSSEERREAYRELPVVVQIHHGRGRPRTLAFGYAAAWEIERRHKTELGPVTLRRFVSIVPTLALDDARVSGRGRVISQESEYVTLRGLSISRILVCTEQAMQEWERSKKILAVRDALDRLDCTDAERDELVRDLYSEDLGSRLDTETADQIALERLEWLRKNSG
jgi:hypothetical protein